MWTTPISYATGSRITASIIGVYWRDNLQFLYEPPRVRAINEDNISVQQESIAQVVDFSRTVYDNDGIHGGTPLANESESGLFTGRTTGIYLITTAVSFSSSDLGSRHLRISRRAVGSSWAIKAVKSIGDDVGIGQASIRNILVCGTYTHAPTAAGYQFAAMVVVNDDVSGTLELIAERGNNSEPYFAMHWRGHH